MTVKVNFVLAAHIVAEATSGVLLGEFNNWDEKKAVKLKKEKDGSLTVTLELEADKTYQYRYLLSDGRWVNDDRAEQYSSAEGYQTENCVVYVSHETSVVETITKKDDLTKIDGIGKKTAELLVEANIDTFSTLSNTSLQTLQNILNSAGSRFKSFNPATWAAQAKLAADDKWDELKEFKKNAKIKN
jgi:predicted flap endonuclease-1-like 5' DNA nuclease